MPVANPAGNAVKLLSRRGVSSMVNSWSRRRMKIAPKIGPNVVPRPPMIIIPTYSIDCIKLKCSAFMNPIQWASSEPAIPAKKQPIKKARSL